ncbi:hypothetical protein FIBSPDRAFT_847384 [Athelia psychrophila]|uniref:Uncharacterized protein n=1 Tax=Athelia psychrophila TaxID=1759441 RepID=A0A166W7C5_9AGAM|nr:hypothetical protein FIBSPDRAFT_847384 [Fibularhizoctonia sp. CBS 109695]
MAAVAELMSSAVDDTHSAYAEEQEKNSVGFGDELEDFTEPYQQPFGSFANAPASPSGRSMYDDSDLEHSDAEATSSHLTYPAFHLPRPHREVVTRDSDTPSLSSSNSYSSLSSFGRGSTPASPAALATPIDHPWPLTSGSHLAIIEERRSEEPRYEVMVVVPETPSEQGTLKQRDVLLLRRGALPLVHLKLDGHDNRSESRTGPTTPFTALDAHSPQPPMHSPSSAGSMNKLARFVGIVKKASKTSLKESQLHPVQSTISTTSTVTQHKVDEKRRKKDEANAKTERLTLELKAKSQQRAIKEKRASMSSAEKRHAHWVDEPAAIFGGYQGAL